MAGAPCMYFSDLKITRIFSNDMVNLFVQQKYIVLSMYKLLLTYIIFRVLIYGRVYTVYCIDHSVMLKYIQCNVTFIMIWLTYDCFYWLFMFITKFTQFIFPNEPQNEARNWHKIFCLITAFIPLLIKERVFGNINSRMSNIKSNTSQNGGKFIFGVLEKTLFWGRGWPLKRPKGQNPWV